jgi:periplasmic copper chaperone A
MMKRTARALVLLLACLLPAPAVLAAVEAVEGWTRETPPGTTVAVGYLIVKNTGNSRRELLKITSPMARQISLHQSSIDANGVARMWPVGKLELSPGETLDFSPNGKHLMLEGLASPLRVGMRVPVTIVFEDEPPVTIQLQVRPLSDAHAVHDMHSGHEAMGGAQGHH